MLKQVFDTHLFSSKKERERGRGKKKEKKKERRKKEEKKECLYKTLKYSINLMTNMYWCHSHYKIGITNVMHNDSSTF